MKTKFKVFTCVFLLITLVASMGFAEGKSAIPAYLLSFFVGFGTGHLYAQAEWIPWLAADAGALGVTAFGGVMMVFSLLMDPDAWDTQGATATTSSGAAKTAFVWRIVAIAGSTAYGIIRVIEFVNIFKVVKHQKEAGVIAYWSPTIDVLPSGVAAGLKYSY